MTAGRPAAPPIAVALAQAGARVVIDPTARVSDRLARLVAEADQADLLVVASAAVAHREAVGKTFATVLGERLATDEATVSAMAAAVHEAAVNATLHGAFRLRQPPAHDEAEAPFDQKLALEAALADTDRAASAIVLIARAETDGVDVLVCDDGPGFDCDATDSHGGGIDRIRARARDTAYMDDGRTCRMRFDLPAASGPHGIDTEAQPSFGGFDTGRCRVLVVDDEASNRKLIELSLNGSGYTECRSAKSGIEALKITQDWHPDLILLDMMMPGIDGIETCRRLRALPEGGNVPIIMQTAAADAATRTAAFAAGASDFVAKPLHIRELVARVSLHLQNRVTISHLEEIQRKLRRELAEARQIQRGLLPDAEDIAAWERRAGIRLAAEWRSSSMLGGDIWGLGNAPNRPPGLFVGDFSGHGLGAALHASVLHREILRQWSLAQSPADLLGRVNRELAGLWSDGGFAAVTVMEFDGDTIRYATAGAPPPRWREDGGAWQTLPARGLPVGISAQATYVERTAAFHSGCRLLVHTDGLSELRTATGELTEDGALEEILAACTTPGPVGALRQLMRAIGAITASALPDDLTAIWLDRM